MRNIQDTIDLQSPLEIKIEWSRSTSEPPLTLSIAAFMLNKNDVIDKIDDFVFYGSKNNGKNIVSSDSAVNCDMLDFEKGFGTESSYKMTIDLNHLKKDVDHIRLVVSINLKTPQSENVSFDIFSKVDFCLKDNKGFRYTTELNQDASPECKCIEVCLVKRYGKSWRFEEEKINRLGGLELSYEEYGERLLKDNPFNQFGDISKIKWPYSDKMGYKIMDRLKAGVKNVKKIIKPNKPKGDFFSSNTDLSPKKQTKTLIRDSFFQEQVNCENKTEKDSFFEDPAPKPHPKKKNNKNEDFSFGKNNNTKQKECDKDPFFKS